MTIPDESKSLLLRPASVTAQDQARCWEVSGLGDELKTGRIMAKDEDLCLHCGLCAERCPTGAWDMQNFTYLERPADPSGQPHCSAYIT